MWVYLGNEYFEIPDVCVFDSILLEVEYTLSLTHPVYGNPAASSRLHKTSTSDFFMCEDVSDVKFLIGSREKEVHANKTILSLRSPVFKRMFFGSLRPKKVIKVPDVKYMPFMSLMRYVYRLEAVIDKNFIRETLYVADKYDVLDLKQAVGILLNKETVYEVLDYETTTESSVKLDEMLSLHIAESKDFLATETFLELTPDSVEFVVSVERWGVDEMRLWTGCVEWAEAECVRKGIRSPTAKDQRAVMLPFLHKFRFPLMTPAVFTAGPLATGILNAKEIADYFQFVHLATVPKIFPKKRRTE